MATVIAQNGNGVGPHLSLVLARDDDGVLMVGVVNVDTETELLALRFGGEDGSHDEAAFFAAVDEMRS